MLRLAPEPCPPPSVARGRCITHHGELIQGAVLRHGVVTLCLVTLPRHDLVSTCRLELFPSASLEVTPAWKIKAHRAARIVLARGGAEQATGRLTLVADTKVEMGLGSSTADVVAAIRASAAAIGVPLAPREIAAIAVEAEVAADPLMFDGFGMLFAQRGGEVIEHWGEYYPDFVVFSVDLAPGRRVDTLSLELPPYSEAELDAFDRILSSLRTGFGRRDPATIAKAATLSARLNQSRLPLPRFPTFLRLAEQAGALGVQIAHSGVVGGALFDPQDARLDDKIAWLAGGWSRLWESPFELFTTAPRTPRLGLSPSPEARIEILSERAARR